MQQITSSLGLEMSQIMDKDRVFVIAEIGKNFIDKEEDLDISEYLENAKNLIDAAVASGADAVKFQTHEVEDEQLKIEVTSPHFKGADRFSWVSRNTKATPIRFWEEIKKYCEKKGIIFFSTPMSRKAAEKIIPLNLPLWKVGSGDVEDYVLLDTLIETKKPIIISTGMVSLDELDKIVKFLESHNVPIVILYCVSKYPCPPKDFNLGTIEYLKEKYPTITIGFSDHSVDGYKVDLAAIKLGARVIEKHFSFSRDFWGADHKSSITPFEMKEMVDAIRRGDYKDVNTDEFFGEKEKELEGALSHFRPYFNKSLVAAKDLPVGTILEKDMIFAMRPKMYIGGVPSNQFYSVLGRKLKTSLKKFDPINPSVIDL